MEKCPILFAFGKHRGPQGQKGNQRFFRKTVSPFLEKNANEGRKIAVILESAHHVSEFSGDLREGLVRELLKDEKEKDAFCLLLQYGMRMRRAQIQSAFNQTINEGKNPEGRIPFAWGFEEKILRLNEGAFKPIICILEQPNAEASLLDAYWENMLLELTSSLNREDAPELMMKIIDARAKSVELRDIRVMKLIGALFSKHGYRAFVIPRGGAHRNMASLFDQDRYELIVRDDGKFPAELSFKPESEEELRECAEKEVNVLKLLREKSSNILSEFVLICLSKGKAQGYSAFLERRVRKQLG